MGGKLTKPFQPAVVNRAVTEALVREFPEDRLVEVLEEMLTASRSFVTGKGENKREIITPDWNARERALRLIMEYQLGKPIQRQEILTHQAKTTDDIMELCRKSPAFRGVLRMILEATEEASEDEH